LELDPRAQTIKNLKQLFLRLWDHHDAFKSFPAAYSTDKERNPLLSWRVKVLPFLGKKALYDQFHLDEPWDSEDNKQLIAKMPPVFRSPASKAEPGKTNYLGVGGPQGLFPGKDSISLRDVTDGPSITIALVEVNDESAVIWTKPDDFVPNPGDPKRGLLGLWPDGFYAVFADGVTRFFDKSIDNKTLHAFFTRNGSEPVDSGTETPRLGPARAVALPPAAEEEAGEGEEEPSQPASESESDEETTPNTQQAIPGKGAGHAAPNDQEVENAPGQGRPEVVEALSILRSLLHHEDAKVRKAAVLALGRGPSASSAIPDLTEMLEDEDLNVRGTAADTLIRLGPVAGSAVPGIIRLLRDLDPKQHGWGSLGIFMRLRALRPDGVRGLLSLFVGEEPVLASRAALMLEEVAGHAEWPIPEFVEALPDLIRLLRDKNPQSPAVLKSYPLILAAAGAEARPALMELLRDERPQIREAAAAALGRMGPEAHEAIPDLLNLVQDEAPGVRGIAIHSLGQMGSEAKGAIPQLLRLLHDNRPEMRVAAAGALGEIGPEARVAVADLLRLLQEDPHLRHVAAVALGGIGAEAKAAIPELIKLLREGDERSREVVASGLIGMGSEAIAGLIALLESDQPQVRRRAVACLGDLVQRRRAAHRERMEEASTPEPARTEEVGAQMELAMPTLQRLVRDSDPLVREEAAKALGKMGAEANAAIPNLVVRLLQDEMPAVRRAAVEALRDMRPTPKAAIPGLIRLIEDAEAEVPLAARHATILRDAPESDEDLERVVVTDADVRNAALFSLDMALRDVGPEQIGPTANTAIPALVRLLEDKKAGVSPCAARILGKMGRAQKGPEAEAAIPHLLRLLQETGQYSAGRRSEAARALGGIGFGAVPELVRLLGNESPDVRQAAAMALGYLGPEARTATTDLVELLQDKRTDVRIHAVSALSAIGPEAEVAIPHLIELLKDKEASVRTRAASALSAIGRDAKVATPHLVDLLDDEDDTVRSFAMYALGAAGPEAMTAIPNLVGQLQDTNPQMRMAAAEAILHISTREHGLDEEGK
jgi:HEAT repeat protein